MCQRSSQPVDGPLGVIVIEADVDGELPPELRDDATLALALARLAHDRAGGCSGTCLANRASCAATPVRVAVNRRQLEADLVEAARRVRARVELARVGGR